MPKDRRPYITVTDDMPDHPKVEGLSDKAFRALVTLWCYSHRYGLDGRIGAVRWRKVPVSVRAELLSVPLAVEMNSGDAEMRHYDQHQQSADELAEMRAKRVDAGRKGGTAKASNRASSSVASATASAVAQDKQTPSKNVAALAVAVERPLNPRATRSSDEPEGFAEFWVLYPRKVGKGAAVKAYAKALRTTDVAALLAAVTAYAPTRAGQDPTYTPHASKWLNDERWQDESAPELTRADYLRLRIAPPGSNPHMAHLWEQA